MRGAALWKSTPGNQGKTMVSGAGRRQFALQISCNSLPPPLINPISQSTVPAIIVISTTAPLIESVHFYISLPVKNTVLQIPHAAGESPKMAIICVIVLPTKNLFECRSKTFATLLN